MAKEVLCKIKVFTNKARTETETLDVFFNEDGYLSADITPLPDFMKEIHSAYGLPFTSVPIAVDNSYEGVKKVEKINTKCSLDYDSKGIYYVAEVIM